MSKKQEVPQHLINAAAERIVLGKVLQSETAYWSAADTLQPQHFHFEIHGKIYGAIKDILTEGKKVSLGLIESRVGEEYGDGQSVMILMTALLRDSEEISDWTTEVETVVDLWRCRRTIETLEAGLKEAKKPGIMSADLISDLEVRLQDINVNSQAQPVKWIGDIAGRVVTRSSRTRDTGNVPGFDTGLASLDAILGRIHATDLGFIAARSGDAKGQPLDALVLTPYGYRKMGDLKIGSKVSAPNGSYSEVIGIYPLGNRQLYRVTFHDGASTEVTDDHIWLAWKRGRFVHGEYSGGESGAKLYTTKQIQEFLSSKDNAKIYIPITKPVQFTRNGHYEVCPIPPYTMGALLGDGSFRHNRVTFTSADNEIVEKMESEIGCKFLLKKKGNSGKAENYWIPVGSGVREKIKQMKLLEAKSEDKFIPKRYLTTSIDKRWELLRGLMDTDGTVNAHGDPWFCSKSCRLANDVAWLARSLGAVVTIHKTPTSYRKAGQKIDCGFAYNVRIKLADGSEAFSLKRKKNKCNKPGSLFRRIVSIEPTRMAESQCIKVSDPTSLYITNDFIVTHNTLLALQLAMRAQVYVPAAVFELEMRDEDLAARVLAGNADTSVAAIESGEYDFDMLESLKAARDRLKDTRIVVDDRPKLAIEQIRDRCIQLKRKHDLGLAIIDHVRLVRTFSRIPNKFDRMEYVTSELKALAKDLKIAVITLSQVSRASQRREDPFPTLNDIDAGGALEQDADWGISMLRRDRYIKNDKPRDPDSKEFREWVEEMQRWRNKIEIRCLKRRRGEDGETREFEFDGRRGLIKELER